MLSVCWESQYCTTRAFVGHGVQHKYNVGMNIANTIKYNLTLQPSPISLITTIQGYVVS